MAVYTELSDLEIREFLEAYRLPEMKSAEGIKSGIENTNYRIELKDNSKWILTLFERRVAAGDLPFFTGLMEQLAVQSLPVPKPLYTIEGEMIRALKGKPAVLATFLEGASTDDIGNAHVIELGKNLARLHKAALDYANVRKNALSLAGWKALIEKIGARADEITTGLTADIQQELKFLTAQWPKPKALPEGVIHADLFPDNVFFDDAGNLTGMIDFYFACNDMLAYDLAVCINSWCFNDEVEFSEEKAKLLAESYHAVRPLSAHEVNAMPVLLRGAALRFLLTRTHDKLFAASGALVAPKDPMEYVKKLRFFRTRK